MRENLLYEGKLTVRGKRIYCMRKTYLLDEGKHIYCMRENVFTV